MASARGRRVEPIGEAHPRAAQTPKPRWLSHVGRAFSGQGGDSANPRPRPPHHFAFPHRVLPFPRFSSPGRGRGPQGNVTQEVAGSLTTTRTFTGQQLQTEDLSTGTDKRYLYDSLGSVDCIVKLAYAGTTCPAAGSTDLLEDNLYDYKSRLSGYRSYNGAGGLVNMVDYTNDPLDRPVKQVETISGSTTTYDFTYIGDGNAVSREVLTGSTSTTKRYAYDAHGRRSTITVGANRYSYLSDVRGSVSLLIDQANTVKESYGYVAYGGANSALTKTAVGFSSTTNPYRYTDKRRDGASGTYDMGARRYSASTGRFLQYDTFYDAVRNLWLSENPLTHNRYALAGANPITFVEIDGHIPASVVGCTAYVDEWGNCPGSGPTTPIGPILPPSGPTTPFGPILPPSGPTTPSGPIRPPSGPTNPVSPSIPTGPRNPLGPIGPQTSLTPEAGTPNSANYCTGSAESDFKEGRLGFTLKADCEVRIRGYIVTWRIRHAGELDAGKDEWTPNYFKKNVKWSHRFGRDFELSRNMDLTANMLVFGVRLIWTWGGPVLKSLIPQPIDYALPIKLHGLRPLAIAALCGALVACGGTQAAAGDCRDLGSISKSAAPVLSPSQPSTFTHIRAFKRQRTPTDVMPQSLRRRFQQIAVTGSFRVMYSQSRRSLTRLHGRSVGAYLVPTASGGLCFGFVSRALALDCVRSFVKETGTWVMAAYSCTPERSSFVAVVSDPVLAIDVGLLRGNIRIGAVNNVAVWRPGAAVRRSTDVRSVTALRRDGRRIEL